MPAAAERRISRMGLTLRAEATTQRPKIAQLQPSMKLSPSCKAGNMSSRAAEAIMPMTAGFMPYMAPARTALPFRRRKKRVRTSMTVSDGRQTAKVAIAEPRMPKNGLSPACAPTV